MNSIATLTVMYMSKEGEIGEWIQRHEYGDIIILCLFAVAVLSLLTLLGWAYFIIEVEYGVNNIKEAVLNSWEALIE